MKKISFIVCMMLVLSACSNHYFSNGDNVYLKSHNGATIEVPPPLTQANISNFYNLPPQTEDAKINTAPPM